MPDGFGNLGAAISVPLIAVGLPTAIDPSTKNVGGWILDSAMGLPERHAFDVRGELRTSASAENPR